MEDKTKIKILKGVVLGYATLTLATGYLAQKINTESLKLKKVVDIQHRMIKRFVDLSETETLETVQKEFEFEVITASLPDW